MSLSVPTPVSPLAAWLTAAILLPAPLLAADDHYLREIEEDAKRQAAVLTTGQPQPAPFQTPAAPTADPERQLAAGLDRAAFEKALRDSLSKEHYAAFQRLGNADQQHIYTFYQSDNRIAKIGEQIAQLAAGKP
ncbi:MAG: hypothetical protein JNK31_03400 [Candidatus Competibacter sp.]|nr:hypothetical protein [Candidatus Competibacter sp.]